MKEIQLSNGTAITKLEENKGETFSREEQSHSTEAEPREGTSTSTSAAASKQHTSPDTKVRNMDTTKTNQHTDRRGRKIEAGDTVHILNTGLFKGNTGTVKKLGSARISIKLASGRSTNQKSTNLEIITIDV